MASIKFIEEDSRFEELQSDMMDMKDYTTSAIGSLMEVIAKKEFYDKKLGEEIKNSLSEVIDKLSNSNDQKEYYDKELGVTIKQALVDAVTNISKIGKTQIDMSPLLKVISSVSDQNKSIIEVLHKLENQKPDDTKYTVLLNNTITMIGKCNEFLQSGLKKIDYSSELKELNKSINKPREYECFVNRDQFQRITTITIKSI